jgi:hypothetical protein
LRESGAGCGHDTATLKAFSAGVWRSLLFPLPLGRTGNSQGALQSLRFSGVLVQKLGLTDSRTRGGGLLNRAAPSAKSAAIGPLPTIDSPPRILAVERQTRHCPDALMPPVGFAFETARNILP